MRLDKYLKVARLIKRRTVANEACDNGLVTVNGKPARASYDVKVGDRVSLRFGARTVTVEVRPGDGEAGRRLGAVSGGPGGITFSSLPYSVDRGARL